MWALLACRPFWLHLAPSLQTLARSPEPSTAVISAAIPVLQESPRDFLDDFFEQVQAYEVQWLRAYIGLTIGLELRTVRCE